MNAEMSRHIQPHRVKKPCSLSLQSCHVTMIYILCVVIDVIGFLGLNGVIRDDMCVCYLFYVYLCICLSSYKAR